MAAETGIPSVYLEHQFSHGRGTKRTRGSLIERLRNKSSQNHSWTESIKSVRSSVAERKTQIENTEPSGVQLCLDTLQKAMKVKSQQTLKERLDLIGRHLGLNTQIQDQKVSLGTDTFQVDVLLGDGGIITHVKLANQGDVVDCPDLKDILKKGDFSEFIEHLQGLQSIYQVTSDEKLKSKAFLALQALEKDLNQLAQFQSSISGVANYIHKCPLGIMLPRLAGKPMKLIYFVSPYDLLDKKSLAAHPLTVEAITENFLGQSVTVCIEAVPESAPANKLQTMPLMNVNKTQDGKSLPSFSAVSKMNSMMLPASFVLVLPRSIPVSMQILQKITSQTNLEIYKEADVQSLRSLILETFSAGSFKDYRRLFVSLPDQQHIYFLDCLNGGAQDHQGLMVSRIPFTHPTHVPQILNLLRQQLLFNIVVGSCVRPGTKSESTKSIMFEVTAVSLQQLTIVFEHPAYDSMTRVDIDLSDITNLKCKVACTNPDQILCSDEAISRVFHRCMSIPIMLRWLITKGRGHLDKLKQAALAAKRELLEKALFLKEMQQQQAKLQPTTLPTNRPPPQPPHPPPLPPPPSYPQHHLPVHLPHSNGQTPTMNPLIVVEARGNVIDEFRHLVDTNSKHMNNGLVMSPDIDHAHASLLTTLLDGQELSGVRHQKEVIDNPMLSILLDDNTSVATTDIPMNGKPGLVTSAKRQRKRRQQTQFSGPSPKHHIGDNDLTERFGPLGSSMGLDMVPSLMDHSFNKTSPVVRSMTPTHGSAGHHHHHPLLTRTANVARSHNNVIDLTEDSSIGESSLKKLADSMDKHFVHKDVKSEPDLSMLLNEAEAQSRIPNILQNSPSGSKNENASTSLEVNLKGSGEVGRAKDFDLSDASSVHGSTTLSKLSSLLLATSDSPSPHLSMSPHQVNTMFFSDKVASDESCGGGTGKPVSSSIFIQDMKPTPTTPPKAMLYQSASVELANDKQGIFDKFDISRQQKNVTNDTTNNEVKSQTAKGKVSLRLRVVPLKQRNSIKPYVKSFHAVEEEEEADLLYGKSNSIRTFDFKSDEDDDDDPLVEFSSDRYVYSASPTRLQISSSKHKQFNDYTFVPQKSDKTKKKDRSSGNSTKRKREKDESKREKKRKKSERFIQESVYRTVETDAKADFKLKIRVAKKPVTGKSDLFADGKVPSYEISKKPLISSSDKMLTSKELVKEPVPLVSDIVKDKESVNVENNTHKIISGKSSTPLNKSSPKSGSSKMAHGNSKTDPKLVTKATIRLKPLTMPNSGSTVNIGQSGSKISGAISGSNKMERRGSASVTIPVVDKRSAAHNSLERRSSTSNLVDRRSATQSSTLLSSAVSVTATSANTSTTTVTANLSLSSILPNAPTVSKIASLPRIPKLSSSSSSSSISRTSSLDPVSGSSPTPAGTKSNNSYTVGPAGRPNPGTASAPGGNRSSVGGAAAASFNYGSRPTTPSNGGTGNNWSSFSAGRPGLTHRQVRPPATSGQGVSQRLPGPRSHSPSVSGNLHKAGTHSVNSHKHTGNVFNNSVKGSAGSSNSPQKSFASGVQTNSSGATHSKMSNNFVTQKSNTTSANSARGHRHVNQSPYPRNSVQTSGSSSGISRSPNMSGPTKSPNSGKSPNITRSGRSPSLNSASQSPNISAANKSPNISSSSLGRSPNVSSSKSPSVSSSKSPSVSNKPVRPVSKASSKCAAGPVSHVSSVTKSSGVNKSIIKTHPSKSLSGSIKSSSAKAGPKTTSASSNQFQMVDSVPALRASPVSISGDTTSSNSPSILSSIESPPPCSSQKSSASQPQITPVPSPTATSSLLSLSVMKTNSFDQTETSRDIVVSVPANEASKLLSDKHSPSSTPSTPQSADGIKSKFNLLSRGRKNSLSAIVDKLKHNAVGAVLDSPGLLCTVTDSQTSVSSKACLNVKSKSTAIAFNQGERRASSSQLSAQSTGASGSLHREINYLLDDNQSKNIILESSEGNMSSPISVSSLKSYCVSRADILSSEVSCIQTMERSQDVSGIGEFKNGFELTISKDDSSQEKSSITNIKSHINFGKEKPGPLQVHLLQQSFAPSLQESTISSCRTPASPLASSFQSVQSPSTIANTLPAIVSGGRLGKDSNDRVFKMPSAKPTGDHLDEESRAFEVLSRSPELRDNKLDNICSSAARDGFDRWAHNHKTTECLNSKTSSKPASSPLSDISSPEDGLIIDDGDSPRLSSKATGKISSSNSVINPQSARAETTSNVCQLPEAKVGSIRNSLDCSTPLTSSPNTSWPPSAKCPAFAKNPSGASTPKESDSPCPIDDDLMDMALGFGS